MTIPDWRDIREIDPADGRRAVVSGSGRSFLFYRHGKEEIKNKSRTGKNDSPSALFFINLPEQHTVINHDICLPSFLTV